MSKQSFRWRCT